MTRGAPPFNRRISADSDFMNTVNAHFNDYNFKGIPFHSFVNTSELDTIIKGNVIYLNRAIILKPITREKIVEVMVEEINEKVVHVPQLQVVDKYVEVVKPIVKYKVKEIKRPVTVERIKKVPKIIEEEKVVEVPEIEYVEKIVDVPTIVEREKIVHVPFPVVCERRIPVLNISRNERVEEVPSVDGMMLLVGNLTGEGVQTENAKTANTVETPVNGSTDNEKSEYMKDFLASAYESRVVNYNSDEEANRMEEFSDSSGSYEHSVQRINIASSLENADCAGMGDYFVGQNGYYGEEYDPNRYDMDKSEYLEAREKEPREEYSVDPQEVLPSMQTSDSNAVDIFEAKLAQPKRLQISQELKRYLTNALTRKISLFVELEAEATAKNGNVEDVKGDDNDEASP
ncbi:hypothetical protein BEWA_029290 [Theileria equi strain WA]|uniref:Uncharacterized protein n=1 Tax=Theileria equi strain WA TaxID=1537102 RepID=L0AYV8_THEEQ|nr:hypothetical protein BEWA_029290 [Theileria equi strain WA]AFZ80079.1 hypothetical protein BEWA_029290 [Theileria equi strain WA]|eukprot:XP_004829745.1 hypothetical protein BEWA_029290 [Theileria equi strain WA]